MIILDWFEHIIPIGPHWVSSKIGDILIDYLHFSNNPDLQDHPTS